MAVVSGLAAAEDVLGFTDQNGVTGAYDADTGVLTLTGTASVADYPRRPALRHLPEHEHGSVGRRPRDRLPRAQQRRRREHGRPADDRHRPQRPREHHGADRARDRRRGHLLAATQGDWTGSTPLELVTRWQRCAADGSACADIHRRHGRGVHPVAADVGRRLRVIVTATNPHSSVEAASAPTGLVRPVESAPAIGSAPASPSSDPGAAITWTGEQGTTFTCSVDGGAFVPCSSPFTPTGLTDGKHTVVIRQTGEGVTGPPLTIAWVLDTVAPVAPTVTGGPEGDVQRPHRHFGFGAPEGDGTMECRVDDGPWVTCSSPFTATVTPGEHTFQVRFVDSAGNAGPVTKRVWRAGAPTEPTVQPVAAR